ncbi:MAG: FAD-binding oxidoreductase [Mycobacterium leprae]
MGVRDDIAAFDSAAVEALATNFAGQLLQPGQPGYPEARRVWNGQIDRRPALISRCSGVADLIAAIRFAREHEVPVAVRGGGHAVAGHAVSDGGLVVDLSSMTGVRVDPVQRTVRLQGGCLNAHLDRETQAFGLATTSGIVSHTGVTGLTLGGGIGHLQRSLGVAVDNLVSADVVTADGRLVVADADRHSDLFWGLRGGGGNFGVVTSTQLRLHPLGPTVLAGLVAWPMEEAARVLRLLRDLAAEAPDALGMMGNLRCAPAVPAVPAELHGRPIVALLLCYAGPVTENLFEIASARLPGLTSNRWDLARCGVFPLVAARVRLRPDGRAVAAD